MIDYNLSYLRILDLMREGTGQPQWKHSFEISDMMGDVNIILTLKNPFNDLITQRMFSLSGLFGNKIDIPDIIKFYCEEMKNMINSHYEEK